MQDLNGAYVSKKDSSDRYGGWIVVADGGKPVKYLDTFESYSEARDWLDSQTGVFKKQKDPDERNTSGEVNVSLNDNSTTVTYPTGATSGLRYPPDMPVNTIIKGKPKEAEGSKQEVNSDTPTYKFCEDKILSELREYIDSTYHSHYADEDRKIQAVEFLMDQKDTAHGFLKGNIQKYSSRYGHKKGHNKDDLLKTIHYAMLLLYYDHYMVAEADF